MRNLYFCLITILFLLSACKRETKGNTESIKDIKDFYEIDLSKDFTGSDCDNMLLSDIVEDVEYVQLETTDNVLLECYPKARYAISQDDIYALNIYGTEELFRFDRATGKFISSIGQIGQGPKDMMNPSDIYAGKDDIYVSSSNHIYIYNKDGQHIRTIPAERSSSTISVINDKYFIYHPRQRPHISIGEFDKWTAVSVTDFEGNILSTKVDTLKGITSTILSIDFKPQRWYYNGQLNFYNEPDDMVYAVTEKGITPRYRFTLGSNKWPVSTVPMAKEHVQYVYFRSFRETSDYLYIYWNQNQKAYFARFDKNTHKLDIQEQESFKGRFWQLFAYGPKNDIDGCGSYFGPSETLEDKTGSILFEINPNNIDRVREALEKAENVKFPEKRQQLLKMLDERKEDDNPILVIYKLKK